MSDYTVPYRIGEYIGIEQVESCNDRADQHFFSPGAKRFFNSRVLADVFPGKTGWYFVSSERFDANSPRLYTVRKMDTRGHVQDVSKFQEYKTSRAAVAAARRASEND